MVVSAGPWRLFLVGGLLVVLTGGAAVWLVMGEQGRLYNEQTSDYLLTQARLLREVVRADWPRLHDGVTGRLVQALGEEGLRIAIVDTNGEAMVHTGSAAQAAQLLAAPEVRQAMGPGRDWGLDVRAWGPLQETHVMAAVRVLADDRQPSGVVWLARPAWQSWAHPSSWRRIAAFMALMAAGAIFTLVWLFVRLRQRVIQRLIQTIRGLSAGEPAVEFETGEAEDWANLARALHALRRRLSAQVGMIDRQRQMLQMLVDHLQEGVIVVRHDGRIALINPTAMRLLNLNGSHGDATTVMERSVEECIPHHPLQRMLGLQDEPEALAEAESGPPDVAESVPETHVEIETEAGRVHLLARATDLTLAESGDEEGQATGGRVLTLTDITALQRAVQVRTDFVANASHELRTPLSTIRAAVETLLTMDLRDEAPAAKMFLEKIDRHSARLEQMVADLLDLSRIETPSERFEPEDVELKRLLEDLHGRVAEKLERKNLHWRAVREPESVRTVRVNPHLLRLVLDNLVDNAAKFTESGGTVSVRVSVETEKVVVEVEDTGCGIPEQDQARVFERFYQVERARSGAERGTGLGLSIVRHAVAALGGEVELQSRVGEGTRVLVRLPQGR